MPERILPSRPRSRKKPVDEADAKGKPEFALSLDSDLDGGSKRCSITKCRWVIVGFHDPDILSLETTVPQLQTINVLISVSSGLRHEMGLGDLEEAFLQGKRIERLLFVEQPKESIFGLQQGHLLRLEVKVNGTVRGTANWRETIRQYNLQLGYVQTRADACAISLEPETYTRQLQNPVNDTERLTSQDIEGEGQEFVVH